MYKVRLVGAHPFTCAKAIVIFFTYLQRDGQAELARVAGNIPIWFAFTKIVTHLGINRVRCRVTSMVEIHWALLLPHYGKSTRLDIAASKSRLTAIRRTLET